MSTARRLWPALLSLMLAAAPAQAAVASYSADLVAPSLALRNVSYSAYFPLPGQPPAGSRITTVYYQWQFAPPPPGLLVFLCQGARCLNVSKTPSGMTAAFRDGDAGEAFYLRYLVLGRGAVMPAISGRNQLAVSYRF